MEPITTRAAAASLFLCGLMVWIGSSVFSQRKAFPILLVTLTTIGCTVALVGMVGVLLPKGVEWLWMRGTGTFAPFVSKNSAGAYLNIAIASALGFAFWSVQRIPRANHSRERGRMPWKQRLQHDLAQAFAHLDAIQLAAFFGVILLVTALLLSLCRGAAIAAVAAIIGAMWFGIPGKRSGMASLGLLLAVGGCFALLVGFQLDERVVTRLESFGEMDLESELRGGRFYIWGVSWDAAKFYQWLGSGLGTFHLASLPFQRPSVAGWYYHAESLYAEAMVTMGFIGLLIICLSVAKGYRDIRAIYISDRFRDFVPIQVAGVYLWISQILHGAVDFGLVLPAVYLPASLLLGATIGANWDSHRIARKVKLRREGLNSPVASQLQKTADPRVMIALSLLGASLCTVGIFFGRQSMLPLALAETVEKHWELEDSKPIIDRHPERVNELLDQCVAHGLTPQDSPQLLRLLADAVVFEGQMRQWTQRPTDAEDQTYWNETRAFVIRVTLDRASEKVREELWSSIGGEHRAQEFKRASAFYAIGHTQSPLDWRLLWGRITSSMQCAPMEFIALAPVMQRTCSHIPQLLTSASILFHDRLSLEDRMILWKTAIRTSPGASLSVAKVMSTIYSDEQVPVDIFPQQGEILRQLGKDVFVKTRFPKTHKILLERALQVGPNPKKKEVERLSWMADTAREAGDLDLEIKTLKDLVKVKSDDTTIALRLVERLIATGSPDDTQNWQDAESRLKDLSKSYPVPPRVKVLTRQLDAAKKRGKND